MVTHVHSALLSVFKLMKIYEEEGILAIRSAVKFPHHFDMFQDPNSQTELVLCNFMLISIKLIFIRFTLSNSKCFKVGT